MKALCLVVGILAILQVAVDKPRLHEASSTGNLTALAGKWQPAKASHHLLDPELVESGQAGLTITVDKDLGDSHRSAPYYPDRYTESVSDFLRENGHEPIASGRLKLGANTEEEYILTQKKGAIYLWLGVGTPFGSNSRVFLGRGAKESTGEVLIVEWMGVLNENNDDNLERDYTTVIYERAADKAVSKRGEGPVTTPKPSP